MKKRRKLEIGKKLMSSVLAMTMAMELAPVAALTANAAVSENLVASLAELYDGDTERARQELEAMFEAGIIDEDGNMVELDVRENGEAVSLDDLVTKINAGEEVGELTINGHATTQEQVAQIQAVKSALEVAKMLAEDVEITDEHVENLESLIEGIADGSVDINSAIESGSLSVNSKKSAPRMKPLAAPLATANEQASDFPETKTGEGEVAADADGNYTAPLISDSTYNDSYNFKLNDPENKTYYTDSQYEGIETDGLVTLTCTSLNAKDEEVAAGANGEFLAVFGGKVTVTATLNKAQSVPVSFDWSAAGAAIAEAQSGTVTWEAGETGEKTFEVTVTKPEGELWRYGGRAFVINATNVKGALLNEEKTAWNQTVIVKANDGAISNSYIWTSGPTLTSRNFTAYTANNRFGTSCNCYKASVNCTGDAIRITLNCHANYGKNGAGALNFGVKTSDEKYYPDTYNGDSRLALVYDPVDLNVSATRGVTPGTNYLNFGIDSKCSIQINSVATEFRTAPETTQIQSVTVPAGTYYTGQVVPVTINLSQYATMRSTNTLTVNGVECPLLDTSGTESNKFTFGYTVRETDTGAINVTALNGTVYNAGTKEMTVDGNFPQSTFDKDNGNVIVKSAVKRASLDTANAKYGISDGDAGEQEMTVLIPFKEGASVEWVGSESGDCTTNGRGISMKLPTYGNVTLRDYLNGAYFSYDNGKTRFPVYVVRQGGEEKPVALVCRFTPPMNATAYLRKDTLNLFMDTEVGIADSTKYLDTWTNKQTDVKGFAYFDGSAKTDSAPVYVGADYTFYAKGGIMFEEDQFISRGVADYAEKTENGWLHLDDGNHVLLNDPDHPENRYDAEIIINDALYKTFALGARVEDPEDLTLTASFSDRRNFTFVKPKDYEWVSSDEEIATVVKDENGVGHLQFTGKSGTVNFSLHLKNGSESKAYDVGEIKVNVLEGLTPFLTISKYSALRPTLTGIDTDIAFASNVTARNAELGNSTKFTAKLYRAEAGDEENTYNKTGEAVWTGEFDSTLDETLTHITVPGRQLRQAGAYYLEISTEYFGGEFNGDDVPGSSLSAYAYIVAEQAPASVSLNELDSYYVTAGNIPKIGYETDGAEVEYTIQKSGEPVSDRIKATNGVIPFRPSKPQSLKEAYTITVYARNSAEDDWSLDSMLLTVYNPDILHQIVSDVTAGEIGGTTGGTGTAVDGTTVTMDNHDKVQGYVGENGYQLTFDDFTALRTDISLQKIVSVNYGEAVYGMLSDKMQWESSDPSKVSVDYKQGGIYSDVRNYSYTSYAPATDFLLVGKDDTADGEKVTITATHANTGISSSFDVTTNTLKDQLYVFQFTPAVKTTVTYTNGKGVKRTLDSDDTGKLAVYEPDGIAGSVMAMGRDEDGNTYVGTLFQSDLQTGERDVASLQLYPCNNLRLRAISNAELTFLAPDGKPYSGPVTIRGGAYKNGVYCPDAKIRLTSTGPEQSGRDDITATVTNGKLKLYLDPTQFKNDPASDDEFGGAQPGDTITYVFEYRFANTYQPGYVTLNAYTDLYGASSPTDSVVYMRKNTAGDTVPQIIHQNLRQYLDGKTATPYTRDVIDYTSNIGVSNRFNMAVLTTDVALTGETVVKDDRDYSSYHSETVPHFMLCTPYDHELSGQIDNHEKVAEQIIDLSDIEESTLFVFPFSAVPVARSYYTMTDADLKQDGLTDEGANPTPTSAIKAVYVKDEMTIKTETLPFGVSNLSHQRDLSTAEGGAEEIGNEVEDELQSTLDIGKIFDGVNVNDMLKKGFVFLNSMSAVAGEPPISMMILPTEDPGTFRIIASIGYNKREMETDTNPSLDFDPNHLYDDMESFQKEMEELGKDDDDKKDDDNEDGGGEGSVHINFYGMVVMEAKVGVLGNKWGIDFCGGTVGTNFEAKYEWSQNFMCGPVPANVSFEVQGTADLEVSFANKAEARALLIDAAVGVSVEAFAGLGFDVSLFALKLGIFGKIGADVNFLYLTQGNQTGTKLDIAGEIGIKLKVKVVLIKYEKVFASTGFNWSKTWGKYNQIKNTWENDGYAELTGVTTKGKPFTMKLLSNGTAMVTIDGGNEIDNRDYLKSAPRMLKAPTLNFTMSNDGMLMLDDNAYPYSNPVLTDDGSMYLYISDNNNADAPDSVVCYAINNGNGYTDMGRVDTSEDNILMDSDVVASGTGSHAFAAWVKQQDSPKKEMHDSTTYDDLGMMLNATEIYGGSYVGGEWTVERLTDNTVADMAPTIASSGDKAIVAWRSLSATEMPEEGGTQDITTMFNAKNTINYRIFDGAEWKEAQVAYNGSAGTVNAVNAAMLSDGTSLVVYSVRTTDDVTGSETFYTLIDKDGNVVTTGRLTNDSYTDTNAQVTAVGDQFIVGWYSEHEAGEEGNTNETVVSHDIGLARINANGSVDAEFPESIGGTAAAKIGSDFHFSAPAGCERLSDLSIVWSQQKESDKAEDEGKYQLNAVRFFESNGVIGVTSQTTIAETAKNNVIDKFDTYTEAGGTVKAILVDSDYSSIDGMNVYDSIDLTNLPIQAVNDAGESADHLEILTQDPTTSVKLASGAFAESAIEVTANTDLRDLMPGLDLPVQFTVRNTGTSNVNSVNVVLGGTTQNFTDLNLLPGQSTVLTVNYGVPEETIRDVDYTLTANGSGTASGTLVLNRPDVGISGMKVVREGDKTRDIRITLNNATEIPLAGSGKTVKLAFYKDMDHENQIGETITIDTDKYQDIDNGICTVVQTLNVTDLIGGAQEVPEDGVRIYARAWVEDTEELYTLNNDANATIYGLLSKYDSQIMMDAALIEGEDGYTVVADISNNSLQSAEVGSIVADILDSRNKVIKTLDITQDLSLDGEKSQTFNVKTGELEGEPVKVVLRSTEQSVKLDAATNKGTVDTTSILLTKEGKPAGMLPDAARNGYTFDGWFTAPVGGELVTNDTELSPDSTIYAQFSYTKRDQSFTVTMNDYEYDGTAHDPSINGTTYGKVTTEYFFADTGEQLAEAPTEAGHYLVKVTADGNYYYNSAESSTEYWITTPGLYHVTAKNGTVNGEPSGEFAPGTDITVKANVPESGKQFRYWKSNGKIVSYDQEFTFTTTSENVEIEAVYLEAMTPEEAAETAMADGVAVDLADAVLKDNAKARFVLTPTIAEGWTVESYGIIYDKTGAVTNADTAKSGLVLNGDYVTKTCSANDGTAYALNVTPENNNTVWAVGYITVSKDGMTATVYTEPKSGNVAEMQIETNAKVDLADAVLKDSEKARFVLTPEVPDGYTINAYGIVYDKTGAVTNAESAKTGLVLDGDYVTKTCSANDGTAYALNVTPTNGKTIWAVGYLTVSKDGVTKTIYTEPKSGNVTELKAAAEAEIDANVNVNLADAVLKSGTKARFLLTPEIADGWTVDAYGIVYDKTGAITSATSARYGLVLDNGYATKTCSAKDGTAYALNVTPENDNTIWAVGYITVTKNGLTKTIYTEPKSAKVSELQKIAQIEENVKITLADAVLKDGTKARFVLTPEIADGWTVDAYGIVYDKTGAVTDAEAAKSGLVLGGSYVTKTCSTTDGTSYALNITPTEDNTIWAVGYVTVTRDGMTRTIYTEPKSAKVSELK